MAHSFFEKVESREKGEIQRTRQVFDLAAANECQPGMLSAHFGQSLDEPCEACSFCVGAGPFEIGKPSYVNLDRSDMELIQQLATANPAALNSSRAIARFLCGIRSPALTRAKLTKHASFGSCTQTPFDYVMKEVDAKIDV